MVRLDGHRVANSRITGSACSRVSSITLSLHNSEGAPRTHMLPVIF